MNKILDKYSFMELGKIKYQEVNSYVQLISKLREFNIKPQEAYLNCIGNKFDITDRSIWATIKVQIYLKHRFIGAMKELNKIKNWKKGEAIHKLIYLIKQRNYKLLSSKKKSCDEIVQTGTYQDYLSINSNFRLRLDYWDKPSKIDMKKHKTSPPNWYSWGKKKILDEKKIKDLLRKESENLHKLVTEKRHNDKFLKVHHQGMFKQLKKDGFKIDHEQSFINFIR